MSKKILFAAVLITSQLSCSDRSILTPLPCVISYNAPKTPGIQTISSETYNNITLIYNTKTQNGVLCSDTSFIEANCLEVLSIPTNQYSIIANTRKDSFLLADLKINTEHLLPYLLYVTVKPNNQTTIRYEVNSFKPVDFVPPKNVKNSIILLKQKENAHEISACSKAIVIIAVASLIGYFLYNN